MQSEVVFEAEFNDAHASFEFRRAKGACVEKSPYQTSENPKELIAAFRINPFPRIAVTVDMIAIGTDIKPVECLIFMRDVKSESYFEQMSHKGRSRM